ncbi:MAG: hypothetical protein ACI8WW_000665 [Oceanospirillaceae bacterium]|jgi:hypothetical protein
MPLNYIEVSVIREKCRSRIEMTELWLRRIISEELTNNFGANFMNHKTSTDNYLIKKDIRENINNRYKASSEIFPRLIDAGYFENLIDIFCNPNLYNEFFKKYLSTMFPPTMPNSYVYLKFCLDRLKGIRNNLSHANSIGIKDAEFVLSFTTELVESFKKFYSISGMQQEYIVPQIITITDSFGNVINRKNFEIHETHDFSKNQNCFLRPGDTLSLEVTVDPSYTDAKYQFRFGGAGQDFSYSNKLVYVMQNNDVDPRKVIHCQVKSDKTWHKQYQLDDQIHLYYKVLPPIE